MSNILSKISCILFFVVSVSVSAQNDIDIIKKNFHDIYVLSENEETQLGKILSQNEPGFIISDRVVMELQQRVPYNAERIQKYINCIDENGKWNDIDYNDNKRSGWEPRLHCERILEMVKSFENPALDVYHSQKLESTIHKAMNFWFTAKPVCKNWYYNEIGIPRTMGIAFTLFDKHLTHEEREKAIEVMSNSKFGKTGQNKVWLANNVMMKGLIENNLELVKEARDTIVSEIAYGGFEGIKCDWSFHQHGAMLQFGNYGLAYIHTMGLMSGLLSNTGLALDNKHLDILVSFINNGYQWIIWNGKMDINALGRQFFSSAPLHKALSVALAAQELSNSKNDDHKRMINGFMQNCYTENNKQTGIKNFWQSDYIITRRKSWMASLKMSSSRVIGGESINGDNMKGYYVGDGVMLIYKDGKEYYDIFPIWDWSKLPGITAHVPSGNFPSLADNPDNGNKQDFVGGLTDGKDGIGAMKLARDGLTFDKLWLFNKDVVVCLGSNITSITGEKVLTTVEQCRMRGNINVIKGEKVSATDTYKGEIRILHNNKGYIVLGDECLVYGGKMVNKGSWSDIMKMYPHKLVSGDIFTLCIDHGYKPGESSYCYVILPNADKATVKSFDTDNYKIISNDKKMQGIHIKDENVCWLSVKEPVCGVEILKHKISFMTPGLYRFGYSAGLGLDITCSDPTQKLEKLEVKINDKPVNIRLPQGNEAGTNARIIYNN